MNLRQFYEARAKSIVKEVRESKDISYKELARRLEATGVTVDVQVLINRINQGKFSFAFALQLLAVMGVEHLEIPRQAAQLKKPEPKKLPG